MIRKIPPDPPAWRQALKKRRKKVLVDDPKAEKSKPSSAPSILKVKTRVKVKPKPKPKVKPKVKPKEDTSIKGVKKWVKENWPEDLSNQFEVYLEKYPKYVERPFRLFHWAVILRKNLKQMEVIHEMEMVQGKQLNFQGSAETSISDKGKKNE